MLRKNHEYKLTYFSTSVVLTMGSTLNSSLMRLAADGQLMAFEHYGFWQPMDTLREKNLLEGLWESGKAPWKVW